MVLDASALIAALEEEPGGERVEPLMRAAMITTVNLCEVLQRAALRGVNAEAEQRDLLELGIDVVSFDPGLATAAAELLPLTRSAGLSLADRSCLALAQRLGLPALTADRAWGDLLIDVEVRLIR